MTWNDPYGVRARIRSVTAVSAPFWGSYLAERVADFGPSLAREIPLEQPHVEHVHVARGARPGQPVARSRHELLDLLLGALRSPMMLGLLARVALNHRLLEDLRPQRMFEVQTSYEPDPVNADASFAYFVTVASPPAAPSSLFDYFDAPQFRAAHGLAGDVRGASVPPGIARSDLDAAPWIEGQMVDGERPAVTLAANDGVVNSLLQTLPRQPPRALVRADHADVLGHFRRAAPPRSGELNSPSGFDERALDALYRSIVDNIHAGATSRAAAPGIRATPPTPT